MNNTNTKEVRNTNKANNAKTTNETLLFPTLSIENIDTVITMIETNIQNIIEYCKKLSTDKDSIKKQEENNKANETLIATMLKAKQINESQAKQLRESMILPIKSTNWNKYPLTSTKYDSFYNSFNIDKSSNENCLQSLTLLFLQTRASLYSLKEYKQYIKNLNENKNIVTDILNKDNCELFVKRCNSQSKRSGQNYKIGKNALTLTENIDKMLE